MKKKYIFTSCIILIVLVWVVLVLISNRTNPKETAVHSVFIVSESESTLFQGVVEPNDERDIFYDAEKGDIIDINVGNDSPVAIGTKLIRYSNSLKKEEVEEQNRLMALAQLNVSNTQSNLTDTRNQKNQCLNDIPVKQKELDNLNKDEEDFEIKTQEIKADLAQLDGELKTLQESEKNLVQTLAKDNLELENLNTKIAEANEKVESEILSDIEGIAFVNLEGKNKADIPVIKIISSTVLVIGEVTEYEYPKLKVDQNVIIKPNGINKTIQGKVVEIDKVPKQETTDTGNVTKYSFKVSPEETIQFGYNVQIELDLHELRISKKSVINENNVNYVFLVVDGVAKKHEVKLEDMGEYFLVLDGLKIKDKVIKDASNSIKDGEKVEESHD